MNRSDDLNDGFVEGEFLRGKSEEESFNESIKPYSVIFDHDGTEDDEKGQLKFKVIKKNSKQRRNFLKTEFGIVFLGVIVFLFLLLLLFLYASQH